MAKEVARLKPEVVFMSDTNGTARRVTGTGAATDQVSAGLTTALTAFRSAGAKLIFLEVPPRSGNLQQCVTAVSSPQDCMTKVNAKWSDYTTTQRATVKADGGTYVDVLQYFCYQDYCPAVIGSTPVYMDGEHLTQKFSISMAPLLASIVP